MSCIIMVSGCSNGLSNYTGVEPQNRNMVEMVRVPYNLNFNGNDVALSTTEIGRLNHFLKTSNITYGDEFSMDFPLELNGDLSELNENRLAYISNLLKDSGLYMSNTVTPYGMEPKNNSGRLLISRYVITLPECGDWRQPSYPNYENASLANLGCASQANLGLMVANPRDLITGNSGSSNAERAAKAVETYQNRVVTVTAEAASAIGGN